MQAALSLATYPPKGLAVSVERVESTQRGAALVAELFEGYYDRIVRYIATRTGNPSEAEDLASEVFVRAVESIDSFEWRGAPVQAWLFRIAHNLVIDYFRRAKRRPTVPLDDTRAAGSLGDAEAEAIMNLEMAEVRRAMKSLTQSQQEVIALRLIAGLPSAEVAVILGKSDGAVREMQHAALKSLRRTLDTAGRSVRS